MASDDEIENVIRKNIPWAKLTDELRILLGSSQREYEKRVLDFSIKNQLSYKDNIVRFVKRNPEEYYENLLAYSQAKMMLYPYHLSDILVREMRITPFTYYINMMVDVMSAEKSYDSIPNFTAVDAMRLLGIGRNQYIELMNQNRANRRLFRRSKSIREILPQKPTNIATIEPWFQLCYGCILENDVRLLSSVEKEVIDQLMDEGPILCGLLDKSVVQRLLSRGLVYLNVPVNPEDFVFVPTLDGFVMNRVQGDYFETLLYKIFVAIDGQTSIRELAETIGIDIGLVRNAVSVFCRLGFVKKRVTGIENISLDSSWAEYVASYSSGMTSPTSELTPEPSINAELADLSTSLNVQNDASGDLDEDDDIVAAVENMLRMNGSASAQTPVSPTPQQSQILYSPNTEPISKRIAFLFDSTLTAFLMMGNLSASLKNHAVTLFEVGKLSDDALDSFIDELQNVNFFAEGEAQRYSEHARTLLYTIQSVRSGSEMDLIRGESLINLESAARLRVIEKSYKLLISMAPICPEACCLQSSILPHLGTTSVELTSPWFRLFLYELVANGPPALLLPMGTHVARLPKLFWRSKRLMLTQGTHEPVILPIEAALLQINEASLNAPVFLQAYSDTVTDAEIVNIPFPFDEEEQRQLIEENDDPTVDASPQQQNLRLFSAHPAVQKLQSILKINQLCGYVVLLKLNNENGNSDEQINGNLQQQFDNLSKNGDQIEQNDNTCSLDATTTSSPSNKMFSLSNSNYSLTTFQFSRSITKDPKKISSNRISLNKGESFDDYVLFDCVFGIPLFDETLNKTICQRILHNQLLSADSFQRTRATMQEIIDANKKFMARFLDSSYIEPSNLSSIPPFPITAVHFDPTNKNAQGRKCQPKFSSQSIY